MVTEKCSKTGFHHTKCVQQNLLDFISALKLNNYYYSGENYYIHMGATTEEMIIAYG